MKASLLCIAYRGVSIWRWYTHLDGGHGRYGVIASNIELAHMQGVAPGHVHIVCVVDDFGNLVRVPA